MLELMALGTDAERGREVAEALGATRYGAEDDGKERPFRSLVRASTDDATALEPAADVGLYVIFARQIKQHPIAWGPGEPTPGVVAAFGLHHRPDLTHRDGDRHWRDVHAPLAVKHHVGMWDYVQCSVVATITGHPYDGVALCSFASMEDLRERFFDDDVGRQAINDDVSKFADRERSPRRVLMTEWLGGL